MYQAFVRAAAVVLSTALLSSGGVVLAQTTEPQPTTMVDTAPLPASDRSSVGAVILMDDPVLAQREAMEQMASRAPDTSAMGAGPAMLLQKTLTEPEEQKAPLKKKSKKKATVK